ncbi:hypothetical protein CFAM422_012985, partial [Trichoderma lentiforme]
GTGSLAYYYPLSHVVYRLKTTYSDAISEAILYPACGGVSSGGVSYGNSAKQGTAAIAMAVNTFHSQNTEFGVDGLLTERAKYRRRLVSMTCANAESLTLARVAQMVKAAIFMRTHRFQFEFPNGIGTCRLGGVYIHPKHNCS